MHIKFYDEHPERNRENYIELSKHEEGISVVIGDRELSLDVILSYKTIRKLFDAIFLLEKGNLKMSDTKTKIESFKLTHPNAIRVYEFYIRNKDRDILSDYNIYEDRDNAMNIISIVKAQFNKILNNDGLILDKSLVGCRKYAIIKGFSEEYLLLDNGAFEGSGLIEDFEMMHGKQTKKEAIKNDEQ